MHSFDNIQTLPVEIFRYIFNELHDHEQLSFILTNKFFKEVGEKPRWHERIQKLLQALYLELPAADINQIFAKASQRNMKLPALWDVIVKFISHDYVDNKDDKVYQNLDVIDPLIRVRIKALLVQYREIELTAQLEEVLLQRAPLKQLYLVIRKWLLVMDAPHLDLTIDFSLIKPIIQVDIDKMFKEKLNVLLEFEKGHEENLFHGTTPFEFHYFLTRFAILNKHTDYADFAKRNPVLPGLDLMRHGSPDPSKLEEALEIAKRWGELKCLNGICLEIYFQIAIEAIEKKNIGATKNLTISDGKVLFTKAGLQEIHYSGIGVNSGWWRALAQNYQAIKSLLILEKNHPDFLTLPVKSLYLRPRLLNHLRAYPKVLEQAFDRKTNFFLMQGYFDKDCFNGWSHGDVENFLLTLFAPNAMMPHADVVKICKSPAQISEAFELIKKQRSGGLSLTLKYMNSLDELKLNAASIEGLNKEYLVNFNWALQKCNQIGKAYIDPIKNIHIEDLLKAPPVDVNMPKGSKLKLFLDAVYENSILWQHLYGVNQDKESTFLSMQTFMMLFLAEHEVSFHHYKFLYDVREYIKHFDGLSDKAGGVNIYIKCLTDVLNADKILLFIRGRSLDNIITILNKLRIVCPLRDDNLRGNISLEIILQLDVLKLYGTDQSVLDYCCKNNYKFLLEELLDDVEACTDKKDISWFKWEGDEIIIHDTLLKLQKSDQAVLDFFLSAENCFKLCQTVAPNSNKNLLEYIALNLRLHELDKFFTYHYSELYENGIYQVVTDICESPEKIKEAIKHIADFSAKQILSFARIEYLKELAEELADKPDELKGKLISTKIACENHLADLQNKPVFANKTQLTLFADVEVRKHKKIIKYLQLEIKACDELLTSIVNKKQPLEQIQDKQQGIKLSF